MATAALVVGAVTGTIGLIHGIKSSRESQELTEEQWAFQQKAQKAQYKSDIATWQSNIEQAKADIEATKSEMSDVLGVKQMEQEQYARGERALFGASGVEMGTGTPLEVMERTAKRQELEYSAIKGSYEAKIEGYELEKEFYGEQVEKTESLLDELFPKKPKKQGKPEGLKPPSKPTAGNTPRQGEQRYHGGIIWRWNNSKRTWDFVR